MCHSRDKCFSPSSSNFVPIDDTPTELGADPRRTSPWRGGGGPACTLAAHAVAKASAPACTGQRKWGAEKSGILVSPCHTGEASSRVCLRWRTRRHAWRLQPGS